MTADQQHNRSTCGEEHGRVCQAMKDKDDQIKTLEADMEALKKRRSTYLTLPVFIVVMPLIIGAIMAYIGIEFNNNNQIMMRVKEYRDAQIIQIQNSLKSHEQTFDNINKMSTEMIQKMAKLEVVAERNNILLDQLTKMHQDNPNK